MNSKLLKSIMTLNGDTSLSLSNYLGITVQSLRNKMNEKGTEFKQCEIARIKNRYKLDAEILDQIFFTE